MGYCEINAQTSEKYCISWDDCKSKWKILVSHFYEGTRPGTEKEASSSDIFGSQLIIMRLPDPLFSKTMFPGLATEQQNNILFASANLASPETQQGTMFPQQRFLI